MVMKVIKSSDKNLMIIEASFVFCKRHNLDYDTFIDDQFISGNIDTSEGSEFDNLCKDLRYYRRYNHYIPLEIKDKEYEECANYFGYSILY